jgi:hypothetical protein
MEKYTKLPQNISNGRKIDQMPKKYRHLYLQDPPKFTQIAFLVLKYIPSGNPCSN